MLATKFGRRRGAGMGAVIGAVIGASVLIAGCTSAASSSGTPSSGGSASVTSASLSPGTSPGPTTTAPAVVSTITRTVSGSSVPKVAQPPAATVEPAAVTGDCPYLSADGVSDLLGQHHGPAKVVNLKPFPICMFYRSDGGWMATVRIVSAATPAQAVAAVNQHVPVAGSQPVEQPAGWIGGSKAVGDAGVAGAANAHSWYAVSKGNIAVIAEANETPSLQAKLIAVCAIYGAKLITGDAPDYCTQEQQ